MNAPYALSPQPLTPDSAAPFGQMLGRGIDFAQALATGDRPGFRNDATDFCHEHIFDTGGGETEIVWLHYRDRGPVITRLEMHLLTEQAVVPLTGGAIVQILARSLQSAPPPAGSGKRDGASDRTRSGPVHGAGDLACEPRAG